MKRKQYILLLACCSLFASCNFLDEYSQDQAYVTDWKDLDELLIGDVYMKVGATQRYENYSNLGQFLHLVADEMDERNTGFATLFDSKYYTFGVYTWQQRTGLKETYAGDYYTENQTWTEIYRRINVCNNILKSSESLSRRTQAEEQGYQKVRGEAHFLRAFYYFWLANVYGQPYDPATAQEALAVPLKTTETVEDKKFGRNTVREAYDLVIGDLRDAECELTAYGQAQRSIYRVDSVGVQLLLSRVYLYAQQWELAAQYARKVIAQRPALQNLNQNASPWMSQTNEETLFSMGGDDLPCLLTDQSHAYKVSAALYNSLASSDRRKALWFYQRGSFNGLTKRAGRRTSDEELIPADAGYNYYYYYNGLMGQQSPVSSLFWLRTSEAYLNLAEALLMQGQDAEARNVLNRQRQARYVLGAAPLVRQNTGQALMEEIRQERRIEFCFEGQRWFDLRRYRTNPLYPSRIALVHNYTYYTDRGENTLTHTHQFTLQAEDPSWTLPLPSEVLDFNTGMPGNNNPWREYITIDPIAE